MGVGTGGALRLANAMGAMSVATLGDYEGLPDEKELRNFLEGKEALGEMSGNMRERPKERQECRG